MKKKKEEKRSLLFYVTPLSNHHINEEAIESFKLYDEEKKKRKPTIKSTLRLQKATNFQFTTTCTKGIVWMK